MLVLALDSGSSSLKHALYEMPGEQLAGSGTIEARGDAQTAALENVIGSIRGSGATIDAVGHRIVMGGPDHLAGEIVTDELLADLRGLVPFDPLHLPAQLGLIQRARELMPSAMHVACFDTAFFRDMPPVARRYPLPASVGAAVRRYGFHGLSYEYIVSTGHAVGRAVVAHLGSGASMAALRDGIPLDTTMGFSPLGGLMMGTRPGDLDPGLMLFLLRRSSSANVDALTDLLTEQSGLLGVSETSGDMRLLLAKSTTDERARSAVELFVYIAVKNASALAGVCGGLDTFIFTGGIGQSSAPIRQAIGAGLAYLGVEIDVELNARSENRVSSERSAVDVLVIPTNESAIIARHAEGLVHRSI